MSDYTARLSSVFHSAPGPVQGVVSGPYSGTAVILKLITGNPDKVEGHAPLYRSVGSQIAALGGQATAAAGTVQGWDGDARAAFDAKIAGISAELERLGPTMAQTAELLTSAAQASRSAGESIISSFRALMQQLIAAYYKAKAAATATMGASLVAFMQWALGMATKMLLQAKTIADRASALLDRVGAAMQSIGGAVRSIGAQLRDAVKALDLPGKAQEIGSVLFNGTKGLLKEAWGSLEGSLKLEGKTDKDFSEKWGNEKDKDSSLFSTPAKARFGEREGTLLDLFRTSGSGEHDADGSLASGEYDLHAGIGGKGNLFAGDKGLGAEGSVHAGIQASTSGSVSAHDGLVSVDGKANAMAGAEAEGRASVSRSGAELKGEAFAGAKADVTGGVQAGGVGLQATAEGWAGAGADGSANVSWDDGKLTVGASLGAAAGLGGKLGVEMTLEPAKTVEVVARGARGVAGWFTD